MYRLIFTRKSKKNEWLFESEKRAAQAADLIEARWPGTVTRIVEYGMPDNFKVVVANKQASFRTLKLGRNWKTEGAKL